MKYSFQTVLERNRRFNEQRRPLLTTPLRIESMEFIEEKVNQQKLFHDLRTASLAVIAVPVFSEPLHPTGDLQGLTTLPISEDTDEYWNTKRTELAWITSRTQNLNELREVSTVNEHSLVVTAAVVEDFTAADTFIYPCFVGILTAKSITADTGRLITAKLEFKEVFLEWSL